MQVPSPPPVSPESEEPESEVEPVPESEELVPEVEPVPEPEELEPEELGSEVESVTESEALVEDEVEPESEDPRPVESLDDPVEPLDDPVEPPLVPPVESALLLDDVVMDPALVLDAPVSELSGIGPMGASLQAVIASRPGRTSVQGKRRTAARSMEPMLAPEGSPPRVGGRFVHRPDVSPGTRRRGFSSCSGAIGAISLRGPFHPRARTFLRPAPIPGPPSRVVPNTLRSTGRVSAAVLASRVLGLGREVVFAALFGAGAVADAYTVAFRIPNLLRDLLAEGALSSAFVPTFTSVLQQEGQARANALGNLVLGVLLVVTSVLTLAGIAFSEELVVAMARGFGGDAAKVALAARLTRIMMPILALVSLGAVWMGMLNAQRRFVVPALAPAVFNVVSVVAGGVVWLVGGSIEHGVMLWSVGTLVAGVAQALGQLPSLWRLGYRPAARLRGALRDPGLRRIARLMAPAAVGLAAVQINIFVNTGFAGTLGDGPVAQLGYAFRLFFLPLGVFGVALATVTTTQVSEEAAKGDRGALAQRVAESASAGWMLVSASSVGLLVLAVPVTVLVYRHGQTSLADAEAIALVLQAYVLGLVPYSLVKILAPAFYSVDRPRVPLFASMTAVVVNIVFNALTYRWLGAPGIALGTGLGALANVLVLRVAFARIVGPLPVPRRAARLLALVLANVVLAGVAWGGWWLAQQLAQRAGLVTWPVLVLAPTLLGIIVAGFFAYTGVLRALGYPGAQLLWSMPTRLLRRGRVRQR